MRNLLYLRKFFQVAYVTNDLVRGQELLAERYGVRHMHVLSDMELPSHPGAVVDIGSAYVGDTMVELIHPKRGTGTLYHGWVPVDGFHIRLHHLGHMIRDSGEWTQVCAAVRNSNVAVAMEGSFGDFLDFLYVDTREELGHYLEYIHCRPAGEAFFGAIPRN